MKYLIPLNAWHDYFALIAAIFGILFAGYMATSILRKVSGRQAFKSARAGMQKLLFLLIQAVLMALGIVGLLVYVLTGDAELIVSIDGVEYIPVLYIARYAVIYVIVYGLIWVSTAIAVNA